MTSLLWPSAPRLQKLALFCCSLRVCRRDFKTFQGFHTIRRHVLRTSCDFELLRLPWPALQLRTAVSPCFRHNHLVKVRNSWHRSMAYGAPRRGCPIYLRRCLLAPFDAEWRTAVDSKDELSSIHGPPRSNPSTRVLVCRSPATTPQHHKVHLDNIVGFCWQVISPLAGLLVTSCRVRAGCVARVLCAHHSLG